MKKINYALILLLVVVSGLVFANRAFNNEPQKKATPLSDAERKAEVKKWEATPGGIAYKKWEASPEGKKVFEAEAKIAKHIREYTNMEGVVTSLSLPPGSKLGFGVMVSINGEDFILSFGAERVDLKVNDKILIKSHHVSHAPKYAYPIITGDYIERDNKLLYKRAPQKDGC